MQATMLAIEAVTMVATSQRSLTLVRLATRCACFRSGGIAGMSRVGIALRDIVTDGMLPTLLTFPAITGTGIVGSSTLVIAAALDEAPEDACFPFRCSPCTVFCQ